MAEQKDKQLWFPHDLNAKDDPKIVILIDELGLEGYGAFWVLIETLRAQKGYKLQLKAVDALARRYNTTSQKMRVVIESYDLFEIDGDEFFFSPSLLRRMKRWDEQKQLASESGKKGAKAKKEKRDSQEAKLLSFSQQDSTKGSLSDPLAITQHSRTEYFNNNTAQQQELEEFYEYKIQNSKEKIKIHDAYKTKLKKLFQENNQGGKKEFEKWQSDKKSQIQRQQDQNYFDSLRGRLLKTREGTKVIHCLERFDNDNYKIYFEVGSVVVPTHNIFMLEFEEEGGL